MSVTSTFYSALLIIFVAAISYKFYDLVKVIEPPVLEAKYWGPGKAKPDDVSIKPFKINIAKKDVDDFRRRLEATRPFTPPYEGTAHDYGINTNLLNEIVSHWKTNYNWTHRQDILNSLPHYTTQISGLNIHFLHFKQTGDKPKIPLLMLHGWPSSFKEFLKTIPYFLTSEDYTFEIVIPSLPGYGFSQGPAKSQMVFADIAHIFKQLMQRLGYEKFYVHGGDLGALIGKDMAVFYPKEVLGYHSTMCAVITPLAELKKLLFSWWPTLLIDERYVERVYPLAEHFRLKLLESGYFHIQATKPDTVGIGLDDSPAALAGYILEKYITGTNRAYRQQLDGGLKLKFNYDDLLDNVMIYWWTKSMTTAVRLYTAFPIYFEQRYNRLQVKVPSACAQYRHEIMYNPRNILDEIFVKLVQMNEYDFGGHFIGWEEPKSLTSDIQTAIAAFRTKTT